MQQHSHLAAVDVKPLGFAVDQFFCVGRSWPPGAICSCGIGFLPSMRLHA